MPGIKLPKIPRKPSVGRGPRVLQATLKKVDTEPGSVPEGFDATKPEWYCYWALTKLGKVPGIDFDFQHSALGGRTFLGGLVADFVIYNPPGIVINIHGFHWHYEFGRERIMKDRVQRANVAWMGIQIIAIDEDQILRNPIYYVKEALSGREHSRMIQEI